MITHGFWTESVVSGSARLLRMFLCILTGLLSATVSIAAVSVDYTSQIKPVLAARCYACHGALKQQGKLRLDTALALRHGGNEGPGLLPGKPADSRVLERVTATQIEDRMPPEGEPLKPQEIDLIRLWIAQGARSPADEKPETDPKDHWAFQPPVRPTVPKASSRDWAQNPIDAFIAAEHKKQVLKPQVPAERSVWLRRVYLDLIGLPPGLQEIRDFESDKSPLSYEKVVDRLLASPQYGERWGRHFMDIWRYSDWYGLGDQLRYSQKHLWHWRDWIVESFNTDKGYDRMVVEMLAADEIAPTDRDSLRATGFLARNYYLFNRTTWMDEIVEHTSKAFLGITMNCAKCHDHKYDPVTSRDYYSWRAFFEPYHVRLDELPGQTDLEKDGLPRAFDLHLQTPTFLHIRGDEKNPDKSKPINATVPAIFKLREAPIQPVALPAPASLPGLREDIYQTHLSQARNRRAESLSARDRAQEKWTALKSRIGNNTAPAAAPALKFQDDFSKARPDLWEAIGGRWNHADNLLKQSETGGQRRSLRSKQEHPADFLARFRFKITGGETWKSVGLSFDQSGESDVLVYLSANKASKLQIAIGENGKSTYPPAGARSREVKTNAVYQMDVFAQGRRVTVRIDGEPQLSYELAARHPGKLQLVTFDAAAEFHGFELHELPSGFAIDGDSLEKQLTDADSALEIARLDLVAADWRLKALQSAHEADHGKTTGLDSATLAGRIDIAARDDAALSLAQTELSVATLERDLTSADAKKKTDIEKKLKAAKESLAKARERVKSPGTQYTSLRASSKALEGPDEKDDHRNLPFPSTSSGRRTALATWIANPQNPLTARVAANHLWLRHFGQALVPTVTDFGRRGAAPTHPELLDWLATELTAHNWSLKHLHRLMVLSRTYRMSSSNAGAPKPDTLRDPENKYYWRMNPMRMDAQSLRDSLLQLSGRLELTLGGPTIDPKKEDTVFRRSLYFTHSKDDTHRFLEAFDNANVQECYRRSESILPQQALALSNSRLSLEAAAQLSALLAKDTVNTTDDAFIRTAFTLILAATPSREEAEACRETLRDLQAIAEKQGQKDAAGTARSGLIHALFNHNDFITIR